MAAAAVAACTAASAATFDPTKIAGVSAPSVTFDTLTVNDYAVVNLSGTPGGSFTESGLLSISAFSSGGTQVFPSGYGSTYGLYVSFNAAGAGTTLTSLSYSVFGYSGPIATFDVTAAGATKSGAVGTMLASGNLVPGPLNTFSGGVTGASLTANTLTFANTAGAFSAVSGASASFINSANQLSGTPNGFLVKAGGGTINLITTPVPEPETYALLLGGLAAVGFVARRRNNG